jgi:hypothetical protein
MVQISAEENPTPGSTGFFGRTDNNFRISHLERGSLSQERGRAARPHPATTGDSRSGDLEKESL